MPWADWICCLSTSVQLDEMDRYDRFLHAGGDPNKWRWIYKPPDIIRGDNITDHIMQSWQKSGQPVAKGTMDEAVRRGLIKVGYQTLDGKFLDESGNETDSPPPGYFFVPKKVSN